MTLQEILDDLKKNGSEQTKKTLLKHGAKEPFYGVKVEHLKKIQKKIKKDYGLSLALYNTGISDAMYLAGLIADETKMTKKDLQAWAEKAYWYMLSEYTVAWVTAESRYGYELAMKWIDSKKEEIASAGWSALASLVAIKEDSELDLKECKSLLGRIHKEIHRAPNRVRYTMNGFIIALGSYVPSLTEAAIETAHKVGTVEVEMGGTACKVPSAAEYIAKVKKKGTIGKKKKMARC